MNGKILILSDLHLGHAASRAGRMLDGLAGVAAQFDHVVINGDAVNCLEEEADRAAAQPLVRRLEDALSGRRGPPVFLTGNHDPAISDEHFLYFEEAGLLVFHGDFADDNPAPWAPYAADFVLRLRKHLKERGGAPGFSERAKLFRRLQCELKVERYQLYERTGWLAYLLRQFVPPTRPVVVIHYVLKAPARVAMLAASFERPVRQVAFGHVHRPGVWTKDKIQVFNTGSFMPCSQPWALCVEGAAVRYVPLAALLEARRSVYEAAAVSKTKPI